MKKENKEFLIELGGFFVVICALLIGAILLDRYVSQKEDEIYKIGRSYQLPHEGAEEGQILDEDPNDLDQLKWIYPKITYRYDVEYRGDVIYHGTVTYHGEVIFKGIGPSIGFSDEVPKEEK